MSRFPASSAATSAQCASGRKPFLSLSIDLAEETATKNPPHRRVASSKKRALTHHRLVDGAWKQSVGRAVDHDYTIAMISNGCPVVAIFFSQNARTVVRLIMPNCRMAKSRHPGHD